MSEGELLVGFELYDALGYIERLDPIQIHINSFVSLGKEDQPNTYVVTASVGEVETLPPNESAYVKNTGTNKDLILSFGIPKGERGEKPVKGKDYYTQEERQELIKELKNQIDSELNDKADILVKTSETASELTLNDSSENIISALSIYGECTQGKNPSPEVPVDATPLERSSVKIIRKTYTKAQVLPSQLNVSKSITSYSMKTPNKKYEDSIIKSIVNIPSSGAVHYKFSGITGINMYDDESNQGLMIRCKLDNLTAGAYILLGNFTGSKPLSVRNPSAINHKTTSYNYINDITKPFEIIIKNTVSASPMEYWLSTDGGNTFSLIAAQGYSKTEVPSMQTYGNVSTTITEATVYSCLEEPLKGFAQTVDIPYTLRGLKNKNGEFEARDEIVVSGGKVKLIKRCNKYTITPETDFTLATKATSQGLYCHSFSPSPVMKKGINLAGCGNFIPNHFDHWYSWTSESLHFGQEDNFVYIITASPYSSKEDLYNYLSNNGANKIYVVYQLATPIETDITNTSCGRELLKLCTHYPYTIISCNTDCAVSYKADTTNAYINLSQELAALKQAIINPENH